MLSRGIFNTCNRYWAFVPKHNVYAENVCDSSPLYLRRKLKVYRRRYFLVEFSPSAIILSLYRVTTHRLSHLLIEDPSLARHDIDIDGIRTSVERGTHTWDAE